MTEQQRNRSEVDLDCGEPPEEEKEFNPFGLLPMPTVSNMRGRLEVFRQYMVLKHLPLIDRTTSAPYVRPLYFNTKVTRELASAGTLQALAADNEFVLKNAGTYIPSEGIHDILDNSTLFFGRRYATERRVKLALSEKAE